MNTKRITKDEKAGHPVIGVILMIAITSVLAIFLSESGCGCFRRSDMQTPTVGAVYQPEGNNYSVQVEKVDPGPAKIVHINYILLDQRGTAVPGVQGSVRDIYMLDFEDQYTNVSFQDKDNDGNLSAGDVFLIKHKHQGGQAEEGYSLLLKFDITGDKMNGAGTRLG